jgi:hypothetical protein
MKFQQLPLSCVCGRAASRIKQVGLTADKQLVIHWRCSQCRQYIYVVKALSDYWRDCPKPEEVQEVTPSRTDLVPYGDPDTKFLHSLGVRFPEEAES